MPKSPLVPHRTQLLPQPSTCAMHESGIAATYLQKAHRVELRWAEAQTKFYKAMWEAARAFACVDAAEVDVRDAKIARLQRQLKVARGRKKLRRGWSTTRVRFML